MRHSRVLLLLILLAATWGAELPYRHSYYLFEDAATGCGACYIPMLVTREPLPGGVDPFVAVVIETYERDSIWRLRSELVTIAPPPIDAPERATRTLTFEGRRYRYQLVSNQETVRLLRNPEGGIPISRMGPPLTAAALPLRDVLLAELTAP